MKLTGDWINTPATQAVCALFQDAGHQVYFVGGCVRNALLGMPVADIDLATDATPDQVIELTAKVGIKSVPTGVEHGTVTVVSEHVPHEVTTFRKDVETFGRHATIAYATDIRDDARRRDFTMNALYAHPDGTLLDPLGGLTDLNARRVRFIDDAGQRIREDYLRILRFFRFHAWYGDPTGGLDPDGLAAVAEHVDGLEGLSRERVGSEVVKLLTAPDPAPSLAAMRNTGILLRILPGADDQYIGPLVHLENQIHAPACPVRRLACLGGDDARGLLRLSKAQARRLDLLRSEFTATRGASELAYRHGFDIGRDVMLLRAALLEQPLEPNLREKLTNGANSEFPVSAQDLMPRFSGPALGAQLKEIEQRWIDSGFKLTRHELL